MKTYLSILVTIFTLNVSVIAGSDSNLSDSTQSDDSKSWFGIALGTGLIEGSDYSGLYHLNLMYGSFISDLSEGQILGGIGKAVSTDKSDKDVLWVNMGFNYKWFTTPKYTFLGQYFLIGIKFNWGISNEFDSMKGVDLNTALGLNIVQTSVVKIGGEISPGVTFWSIKDPEKDEYKHSESLLYLKFTLLFNFH